MHFSDPGSGRYSPRGSPNTDLEVRVRDGSESSVDDRLGHAGCKCAQHSNAFSLGKRGWYRHGQGSSPSPFAGDIGDQSKISGAVLGLLTSGCRLESSRMTTIMTFARHADRVAIEARRVIIETSL
ncbi:MAG TPA: hypothetical protein VMU99_09015 [Acidimicrobiales bacterium]|nr:hypothetical protein [Acidimicrobiales bacterium]